MLPVWFTINDWMVSLHLYRSLLLWCGSWQGLWQRYRGGPLQSLSLCWSPDLWHKRRSDACSGDYTWYILGVVHLKKNIYIYFTLFFFFNATLTKKMFFSGNSRLDHAKGSKWVITSGWLAFSCTVSVKILVWLPHLTPSQSLVTGMALVAIQTLAQRRWEKKVA